jgi:hypothetical protein
MSVLDASEVFPLLGVINATAQDEAVMSQAITDAQQAVENYVGYPLEQATHTEYYPVARQRGPRDEFVDVQGDMVFFGREGDQALILENRPVRNNETLAVYEHWGAMAGQLSGAFPASTLLTKGSHYWLDVRRGDHAMSGILYRRAGTWCPEPGSIKVVYTAGFTALELAGTPASGGINAVEVRSALLQETCRRFKELKVNQVTPVAGWVPGQITAESQGGYSASVGGSNVAESANVMILSVAAQRRLYRWKKTGGRLA